MFTDVEGSTRLWQSHPEQMAAALARHDELLRAAIVVHHGYVFSTAGDAFAAAFGRAADAVDAAISAQQALQREPWPDGVSIKVRMGIHTGEAVERGGDYFGPALNRGARVMAAAHGSQVLVTGTTAQLLDGSQLASIDLGEHSLRDIDGAERLLQLTADGLVSEFPPVRSLTNVKSSLPSQRSSFVGRDEEITRARTLLQSSRLVTMTGAGGCGKTRLAIEVAARENDEFTDGTFFVDLARVGDDDAVAEAFANAIDFAPEPGIPTDKQIRSRLGNKRVLLVVDNCEHVLDEIADQLDALLGACPNTSVIATSRESLDVDGEQTMRVPSLAIDVDSGDQQPTSLVLFIQRAADIGSVVDPADDAVIIEICRKLDGLPLAIELAAARTGVLSPPQILERLDDRFTLLTGGRRRTRGRQQTLEATIDWSYDLLNPDEQDALRRVSVMPGAFDLNLAAATLARPTTATLDLLDALVARSLLHTERADDTRQLRYRLLETIRVYAHQRLVDHGEAEETRDRHAQHIAQRLEAISAGITPSSRPEHDTLADDALAALEWTRVRDDVALGARIASCAGPVFVARGLLDKGDEVLAWAASVDDPWLRSKALCARAFVSMAGYRLGQQTLFAGQSLRAAGDLAIPWRAFAHMTRVVVLLMVDERRADEEIRLGLIALQGDSAQPGEAAGFDCLIAGQHLWRGQYTQAIDVSERSRWDDDVDALISMNLHSGHLLGLLLSHDAAGVEAHLHDPRITSPRVRWQAMARRGEHWLMSYETIRAAAQSFIGDHDEARSDIAAIVEALSPDRMQGVDADLLGALAWICVNSGELDRARELLEDSWLAARSPNTTILLLSGYEHAHDIHVDDAVARRPAEIARRFAIVELIEQEQRTRRMLDSELARLGLTTHAER